MSLPAKFTVEAPVVWKYLNGLFVIYKPSGLTFNKIRSTIISNLCRDLNSLEVRPPSERVEITKQSDEKYDVQLTTDLSDTIQAVGPRYQNSFIKLMGAVNLGKMTSGVMLLGIDKDGINKAFKIRNNSSLRVFHATGKLGSSTENHFSDTRAVERAKYDHVYEDKLLGLIASMQASHQRKAFDICGVDLQSQAAYEIAAGGPVRPATKDIPIIYSIKCLEVKRPYFTLEIASINENEDYLARLIHEIGLSLRTHAHCTKLRCVRHGIFNVNDALIREKWNLQNILTSMADCNRKLKQDSRMLRQTNPGFGYNSNKDVQSLDER